MLTQVQALFKAFRLEAGLKAELKAQLLLESSRLQAGPTKAS
jgi:hypothetical protein